MGCSPLTPHTEPAHTHRHTHKVHTVHVHTHKSSKEISPCVTVCLSWTQRVCTAVQVSILLSSRLPTKGQEMSRGSYWLRQTMYSWYLLVPNHKSPSLEEANDASNHLSAAGHSRRQAINSSSSSTGEL